MVELAKVRELITMVREIGPHLKEDEINSIFYILLASLKRMEKEGKTNASN